MQKISIKREQSQAGLSFAERENRRSLAGGESKFRPQVKNKLLLLLALLMTAATGVWAQDAKHLITATYDKQTRLLEQPLPYATTIGELYEAVSGKSFSDLISTMSLVEKPLTGISSNNTSVVSIGELNGASTPVTVNADGKATININFSGYVQGIFVSAISPLYANMKDGVKDADKWTAKVGEGQAQALPIGGLKGDGSETVTLQYNGRLKVKGVKAVKKAAGNAYLKWDADQKKLVATEFPAEVTTVENANADVNWAAGTYVVEGDVTINGTITLNGDVNLIIKDGAKLTAMLINGSGGGDKKNFRIYGQSNQSGQLVVNCQNYDAIMNMATFEVHGCQVKATSSHVNRAGFFNIVTFNVYGGSIDAENTGSVGDGIYLNSNDSMNIYGGDVKTVGKGHSYGINGDPATVTVYGGKLWAEDADNKALNGSVTLAKGAGFTGKIETSSNGSSWTEYTTTGTPDAKYVRVGY